jgi:hypothetical protein
MGHEFPGHMEIRCPPSEGMCVAVPQVGVLVMDETGAVGLDLSFVETVFLMEPLPDASLEHQARVDRRYSFMGPLPDTGLEHQARVDRPPRAS